MKTTNLVVPVSIFVLAGLAFAAQSGERKEPSSMMQEMMNGGKQGEHKDGMMRMMKMMDHCASMMESAPDSAASKESPKQ